MPEKRKRLVEQAFYQLADNAPPDLRGYGRGPFTLIKNDRELRKVFLQIGDRTFNISTAYALRYLIPAPNLRIIF